MKLTVITDGEAQVIDGIEDINIVVQRKGQPRQQPYAGATDSNGVPTAPPLERPKVSAAEEAEVKSVMDAQRATFTDPYDCAMCRNAGALCLMHEKAQANGQPPTAPPKHFGEPFSIKSPVSKESKICENCLNKYYPLQRAFTRSRFCSKDCRIQFYSKEAKAAASQAPRPAVEPSPPPEIPSYRQAEVDRMNENFTDPWDCQACRDHQRLCTLHEKMALRGSTPLRYHHAGSPGRGSNNDD